MDALYHGDRRPARYHSPLMPERPNILWICTDQQRRDTLGCAGNPFVRTPHLDALAAGGVRFDRCFVQNPLCAPSRASFLTGRYPRTTRMRQNGQTIPADELMVTRLLADAGYHCGLVGKLHTGATDAAAGFISEERRDDGYHYFQWSPKPFPDWRDPEDYSATNAYAHWLIERGVPYPYRDHPFKGSRFVQVGIEEAHHQTTWCAEKTIAFIQANAGSGRPWLLSMNPFDPHHPFDPPADYLARYLDRLDQIPLPAYRPGELDDKPVFQRRFHEVGAYNVPGAFRYGHLTDRNHRLVRAAYWAMVDLIDVQVGRILDALEQTGQRDRTLVIFTSDHGEMLGDHGIYLKGPFFYEQAVGVPLVVSLPGTVGGGRTTDALIEAADLAPTLAEAAGMPVPAGMQGRSWWPQLTGEEPIAAQREDVYSEYYNSSIMFADPEMRANLTMVRTDRHKLVVAHGRGEGELYDLQQDPEEAINRFFDPDYREAKLDMLSRLTDRMAFTADPLPERRARW